MWLTESLIWKATEDRIASRARSIFPLRGLRTWHVDQSIQMNVGDPTASAKMAVVRNKCNSEDLMMGFGKSEGK